MIRSFTCLNCKQQFEADDKNMVICPHCKSDNVEYTKHSKISGWVWKSVAAVVVLLIAYFVATNIKSCSNENNSTPTPTAPTVNPDTCYVTDPPTVTVSEPIWNNDSKYSVEVKAKNVKNGIKFYFVMLSHFDRNILQKNADGRFSGIPHCDDDGHSYDFAIMDGKEDTLLCVPIEQTGFVKQITIDDKNKMTIEQLQRCIDSQDRSLLGVGENEYLAPDYKLEFVGMPADVTEPESWNDLFEMIEFEIIQKVSVVEINYDDRKRINKIKLKVIM